jgi:phage shock protein PspC (stress-responsive transcriptional regulator)
MQRISVTARLNGSTLQFDEAAFARLESYLAEASRALTGNPDQAEIIADLEQAIADQCSSRMQPDQSVVTLAVLQPALDEIGSVQVPGNAGPDSAGATDHTGYAPRPLQQVSEGAIISGVCQGFARYFGLDVTLLRIIAVVLLIASGGTMIVVYLVLMLLLPYAPVRRGGAPIGKIPAKSRQFVEYVRSKFSVATN